jgi:hypothetical protein
LFQGIDKVHLTKFKHLQKNVGLFLVETVKKFLQH